MIVYDISNIKNDHIKIDLSIIIFVFSVYPFGCFFDCPIEYPFVCAIDCPFGTTKDNQLSQLSLSGNSNQPLLFYFDHLCNYNSTIELYKIFVLLGNWSAPLLSDVTNISSYLYEYWSEFFLSLANFQHIYPGSPCHWFCYCLCQIESTERNTLKLLPVSLGDILAAFLCYLIGIYLKITEHSATLLIFFQSAPLRYLQAWSLTLFPPIFK